MNPVGKYFKTDYSHYYCYGKDSFGAYNSIRVEEGCIETVHYLNMKGMSESTREDFMKAYARTIETIDGIVEGRK